MTQPDTPENLVARVERLEKKVGLRPVADVLIAADGPSGTKYFDKDAVVTENEKQIEFYVEGHSPGGAGQNGDGSSWNAHEVRFVLRSEVNLDD